MPRTHKLSCTDIKADHSIFFSHTKNRWLLMGNVIKQEFELRDKFIQFFNNTENLKILIGK